MMLINSVFLMICATMGATSYQLSRTVAMRSSSSLRMAESYTVVQAGADPKASLLADVCSYSRTQMNEYVLALEKINPTAEPASAPLLNGVWEIVATGFGSPGIIGFQAIKAIPGSVVDVNGKIRFLLQLQKHNYSHQNFLLILSKINPVFFLSLHCRYHIDHIKRAASHHSFHNLEGAISKDRR